MERLRSMLKAINNMMMDMLAAIARKDYQDRRRRQAEGIKKAKEGKKSSYYNLSLLTYLNGQCSISKLTQSPQTNTTG